MPKAASILAVKSTDIVQDNTYPNLNFKARKKNSKMSDCDSSEGNERSEAQSEYNGEALSIIGGIIATLRQDYIH